MTLRLQDSLTQELRDFVPLRPGFVGIYLCGPTVQSAPHVGHLRSALSYDLLRRWLEVLGLRVTLIRNVTDIDDKVLERASSSGEDWWALAYRYEQEFNTAYRALGILPPSYEPRATANIAEMLELIEKLVAKGHAYQAANGSANVFFDSASWPEYGQLTRQKLDDMEPAEDADPRGRKSPSDFALWKAHKENEPTSASWPSRFGAGRPGWHIECSAMAVKYLGESFDIHAGGLDLRFPHHENELAQSRAAGHPFANFWLHNGLVQVAGQKMSKSLGNSIFASELFEQGRAVAIRYWLASAQYRSVLDYQPGSLAEADAALERIENFFDRAARRLADTRFLPKLTLRLEALPAKFTAAMNDDLNVPAALAVLHETVRAGNAALDAEDLEAASKAWAESWAMLEALGVNPTSSQWQGTADSSDAGMRALDSLLVGLIEERNQARRDKDFAKADAIRDRLLQAGIQLEDAGDGTHWSIDDGKP